MSKKTYVVTGTDIHHDGKAYPEGKPIDLEDEQAERLKQWLTPLATALEKPNDKTGNKPEGSKK
jgi:hypothetical protein